MFVVIEHSPHFLKTRRFFRIRFCLTGAFILAVTFILIFPGSLSYELPASLEFLGFGPRRMPISGPLPPLPPRAPCFGPRGKLLSGNPDDELRAVYLNKTYPRPFFGSYEDVGLETTWMTFDDRYGPYGYGEDKETYSRQKVDWNRTHWGRLQNQCFARNLHRFPSATADLDHMSQEIRFSFKNRTKIPTVQRWERFTSTRRTAIVLRVYSGYAYQQEDMLYIRSLIVEAGLKSGGENKVVLLVDMKDKDRRIFDTSEAYAKALADSGIPPEFRSIAVLWDDHLLESWYPKIPEHRTMWQVYQPLQLFALHYPEFDHYWQLELDMRFLGDAGHFLDAVTEFARKEPRKQALERSTFQQIQDEIGSYLSLQQAVNVAAAGGSYAWGPLRIPDVKPIGPRPPTDDPLEDDFKWGVGEEADVIVTSFCQNVLNSEDWVFKDWIGGFAGKAATPRFFCPPAIARSSRALLLAAHEAQIQKGLYVPSEATLISFALWHSLKISYPPQPVFWRQENDEETRRGWWKGGPLNSTEGIGPKNYNHPGGDGLSFWWGSAWPRHIVDAWKGGEDDSDGDLPWILADHNGEIYAPNALLHPVKQ